MVEHLQTELATLRRQIEENKPSRGHGCLQDLLDTLSAGRAAEEDEATARVLQKELDRLTDDLATLRSEEAALRAELIDAKQASLLVFYLKKRQ